MMTGKAKYGYERKWVANKKVVTLGEVMLCLTTPRGCRFSQSNEFIAIYVLHLP